MSEREKYSHRQEINFNAEEVARALNSRAEKGADLNKKNLTSFMKENIDLILLRGDLPQFCETEVYLVGRFIRLNSRDKNYGVTQSTFGSSTIIKAEEIVDAETQTKGVLLHSRNGTEIRIFENGFWNVNEPLEFTEELRSHLSV